LDPSFGETTIDLRDLAGLTALRRLDLSTNALRHPEELGQLRKLQSLDLRWCYLADVGGDPEDGPGAELLLPHLHALPELQRLAIGPYYGPPADLYPLLTLPALQMLAFEGDPPDLTPLAEHESLRLIFAPSTYGSPLRGVESLKEREVTIDQDHNSLAWKWFGEPVSPLNP
ncbi:MAG TPA: hypothetical protein VEI97_16275, partial [bacterium]|nr:hypothetical protein [bacterium]